MKQITIVCLTVITIVSMFTDCIGYAVVIWMAYGIYKIETK